MRNKQNRLGAVVYRDGECQPEERQMTLLQPLPHRISGYPDQRDSALQPHLIQTLLPPAITTMLYFIIFGNLIGQRIGKMDGVRYIDFIVPGLILMAVITNSYSNVVSSFSAANISVMWRLLISPVPSW